MVPVVGNSDMPVAATVATSHREKRSSWERSRTGQVKKTCRVPVMLFLTRVMTQSALASIVSTMPHSNLTQDTDRETHTRVTRLLVDHSATTNEHQTRQSLT